MNKKDKLLNSKASLNEKVINLIIIIISIFIFLNFSSFFKTTENTANLYDFILFFFNDIFISIFILPISFILLLYKTDNNFDSYILLKFKNKKDWFVSMIKNIGKILFKFISSIILLIFILSLLSQIKIIPSWSEYSLSKYNGSNILSTNPIIITLIQITYSYMYILILSIIFLILNKILKGNIFSFIIVVIINFSNFGIILSRMDSIGKISLGYNMLLDFHYLGLNPRYPTILFSAFYWSIGSIILYLLGKYLIKKIDLV